VSLIRGSFFKKKGPFHSFVAYFYLKSVTTSLRSRLLRYRVLSCLTSDEAAPATHQDQGAGDKAAFAPAFRRRPRKPLVHYRIHITADFSAFRFVASDFHPANAPLAYGRGVFAENEGRRKLLIGLSGFANTP
jgi:hypothetical protein